MANKAYAVAKEMALNNGQEYHLAALLWRRGKLLRIGINSNRADPSHTRYFEDGDSACCTHAEMDALCVARPGDYLEVMRWKPNGKLAMAKPCEYCQLRIRRLDINVRYTDENGNWARLTSR
jgi:hypothetical protein